MKIDKIIDAIKDTTNRVVILVNKETIDNIFCEIPTPTDYGVFKNKEINNGHRGIYRSRVHVYFIDIDTVDMANLKN